MSVKENSSISQIKDDRLLHIFMLLHPLELDQVRQVCRRFERIVIQCFRRHKRWQQKYLDGSMDFDWMVRKLHPFLEEVNLTIVNGYRHNLLEGYVFQKTKTLIVNFKGEDNNNNNNVRNDVNTLVHAFPNLCKLCLKNVRNVRSVKQLRYLQELTMSLVNAEEILHCPVYLRVLHLRKLSLKIHSKIPSYFKGQHFPIIETLQELTLSWSLYALLLPRLNEFPNLRKIGCLDQHKEIKFATILDAIGSRMRAVYSYKLFRYNYIEAWSNVLFVREWRIDDAHLVCRDPKAIKNRFQSLHKLYFLNPETECLYDIENVKLLTSYSTFNVLHVIEACPNLKILAFPKVWINKRFTLLAILKILYKQPRRKSPLQLILFVDDMNDVESEEEDGEEGKAYTNGGDEQYLNITKSIFPMQNHPFHFEDYNNEVVIE